MARDPPTIETFYSFTYFLSTIMHLMMACIAGQYRCYWQAKLNYLLTGTIDCIDIASCYDKKELQVCLLINQPSGNLLFALIDFDFPSRLKTKEGI